MRSITELIVGVADLAEAEGRVLRAMTVRVASGLALIIVAAAAFTAGVALLLGAIYIATAGHAGAPVAAAVTGAVALLLGGILAWLGRRMGS